MEKELVVQIVLFIIFAIVLYKNVIETPCDKDNFTLIRPKGSDPAILNFEGRPLMTASSVSMYKKDGCYCNDVGSCDYCLDTSMEERSDHLNHMLSKSPKTIVSQSISQQRNLVSSERKMDSPSVINA
jgi:hypothetical protein